MHILVTGARSSFGQLVVEALNADGYDVTAIVSARAGASPNFATVVSCDLTGAPSPELIGKLQTVDAVIHLAWDRNFRSSDTCRSRNRAMLDTLLSHAASPRRVVFVSTVAAAAVTPSQYGSIKFALEQHTRNRGGRVCVVGLVEGIGAHRLLSRVSASLPLRLRFMGREPRVYPATIEESVAGVVAMAIGEEDCETGAAFDNRGTPMNRYLGALESRNPKLRLPVPLFLGPLIFLGRVFQHLGVGVGEKLLTFLVKDEMRLVGLPVINDKRRDGDKPH